MSYLIIKLQPTPALFDSVLNNSKHGSTMYHSLAPKFHRPHVAVRSKVKELSTSLKALPLKNTYPKSDENILLKQKANVLGKLSKLMKISNPKTTRKKGTTVLKKTVTSKFDSTKSYDPNLLDHNLKVEKVFKNFSSSKSLPNITSGNSSFINNSEKISENALSKQATLGNLSKQESRRNNMPQKNLTATEQDLYRSLEIIKTGTISNPLNKPRPFIWEEEDTLKDNIKPVTKSFLRLKEDFNIQKDVDFENFTSHLSPYTKTTQLLLSSLDIYITNNMVLEGCEIIKHYRRRNVWKNIAEKERKTLSDIYNLLLHGLSEKGNWDLMQMVTRWMALDNIKLDSESFAALFYCLATEKNSLCLKTTERNLLCKKKKEEEKREKFVIEEVNNVITQLFVNNISLDDIFSKAILSKEKAEKILALIQKAVPSFNIQPVTINLSSDCPLIKNLMITENNLESPVENIDIDTMKALVEEQLVLEDKFLIDVKAVNRGYSKEICLSDKQRLEDFKKDWRNSIEQAIHNTLKLNKLDNLWQPNLYTYLNSIPPKMIVDIMMETTLSLIQFSGGYSPSTAQCANLLSKKISYRYQIIKKHYTKNIDRTKALFNNYLSWYLNPSGPAKNARQKWQMLIQISDNTSQLDSKTIDWPAEIKMDLGKYLLDLIIKEVKFPCEKVSQNRYHPVFCTVLRFREGYWREEIKCHPSVTSLLQKLGFDILFFRADQMPMVCPPKPWKSVNHGGYLSLPSEFLRKSFQVAGKVLRLEDIPLKNLYPTLDALNTLQGVSWTINEEVLDAALKVFREGGSRKLGVPHFPQPIVCSNEDVENLTYHERLMKQKNRQKLVKKNCEDYCLWVEALYRLSLANHFRKRLFWLPQNCDFRGRVYPVPALLNHLGSDLYRSLLLFGKGKPLGPKGLDWLMIHLINLTGSHKRRSVLERLAFANEILPLILDSAEKPFTGSKWWMESDEPWQTLAACMEIKKALSVPEPENYVSRFPVHQDGSCNGLQHYAALGKDSIGARSVNLAPLNTPQDVYAVVAKLVEEVRAEDEAKGVELAKKLRGLIERKVIKQTVMTTVYGVTPYGARLQIAKRLAEIPNLPTEYVIPGAAYLADKTFLCLKKMFNSAREIQDWLVVCASAINSLDDYVQWVSPLGLPVLQIYGKYKSMPSVGKSIIVPNKLKQKNAFPPNFIHSLDSAHMMLTALFCEQAGITFASVHDCFWTHAKNVDLMNKICREQFISLHSQPILDNLSQFFIRQYLKNNVTINKRLATVFEAVPEEGSFDIKEILNSVYFFS